MKYILKVFLPKSLNLFRAVRSASSATTPANAKSSPSSLGTPSPSIASSSSGASGTSSNERLKASGYGNAYWALFLLWNKWIIKKKEIAARYNYNQCLVKSTTFENVLLT